MNWCDIGVHYMYINNILTLHYHTGSIDVLRHVVSWSDNSSIYFHHVKSVIGNAFRHILITY